MLVYQRVQTTIIPVRSDEMFLLKKAPYCPGIGFIYFGWKYCSGVFNYGGMSLLRIEDPTWHRMTLLGDFGLFED